jgi:hypothetical protein
LIFHVLFLNTPPRGAVINLAGMLIAFAFSAGGLFRSRWPGMLLAILSIFFAILGTWLIHVNFAASLTDLTPVFRYDYAWTLAQVAFTAFCVALPIGIFGNLVNLTIAEE